MNYWENLLILERERDKLFLFVHNMIVYVENPEESAQSLKTDELSKILAYKINNKIYVEATLMHELNCIAFSECLKNRVCSFIHSFIFHSFNSFDEQIVL